MGVDLGQGSKAWSGACAAIVEGDSARVVENAQGSRSTPSVVAFSFTDGGELLVGQPAKKLLFARGATPVSVHTQLLGLRADAPELDALRAPAASAVSTLAPTTAPTATRARWCACRAWRTARRS
jgi:molecular chaperone DnaK